MNKYSKKELDVKIEELPFQDFFNIKIFDNCTSKCSKNL